MTRSDRKVPEQRAISTAAEGPIGKARLATIARLLHLLEPRPVPDTRRPSSGSLDSRLVVGAFAEAAEGTAFLGPEVVGATVLLGDALATVPDLLGRILRAAPVVVVEVPSSDWIEPMTRAAAACFGTSGRHGRGRSRVDAEHSGDASNGCHAVVIAERGSGAGRYALDGDARATSAFRDHRPLIGIKAAAGRNLPEDLLQACEATLVAGGFDQDTVELVIRHVVGIGPSRKFPAELATAVGPRDLRIAVHRCRGADGSARRLADLIAYRRASGRSEDGPALEDLPGYGPAAEWGLAAAADLASFARGELAWASCQRGALLIGLPGTGKSVFGRALARQAGAAFLAGSLAQWQSTGEAHLGTTLKAMRQFFDDARRMAPCVALIDELDSFGDRRGFAHRYRDYSIQVVNGLLECLDGAEGRPGVLVVGTTNNPDGIDPAITRSGRFDRRIFIPLPSLQDLEAILRHYLGGELGGESLEKAARSATGATGADCAAWIRSARSRARRAGRGLTLEDLLHEIRASSPAISAAVERRIAIHESGHAIVAQTLGMQIDDVVLRSPDPSGTGFTVCRSLDAATREGIADVLTALLGGRAAETLVLGAPSTGAAADLAAATALADDMHHRWGMGSRLGVAVAKSSTRSVRVVERELRLALDRATRILVDRREQIDEMANALIERRALTGAEVSEMLRPAAEGADGFRRDRFGSDTVASQQHDARSACADERAAPGSQDR
ncbi:AAA family ATPase [Methylobacterium segetis]|uniref:AAA family ATPase n=1 Tax=Methylobacterium segetis TaxID=2488750 RepID=UPI001050D00E|nr:AAA family ATPase [Methylobacterium segetis]